MAALSRASAEVDTSPRIVRLDGSGTFMRLIEDPIPRLVYSKILVSPRGVRKGVSASLEVREAALAERIRVELQHGDTIEFTEETHWGVPGIPRILVDFRKV